MEPVAEGTRIFIVEDEKIVADDLAETLQTLGYRIAGSSGSGEAAVEQIPSARPDLILMDIHLAGQMDGIRTAEVLAGFSDVPVVYLTAFADTDLLQRAKVTEPYGYIIKPYYEHELQTIIEIALYRHAMQKSLKESEERYRLFVTMFPGIAFRLNNDFSPVFYHGAVERITGYSEADLMAGNPSWKDLVHGGDRQAFHRENETIRSDPSGCIDREYRILRKDGNVRWVHELVRYFSSSGHDGDFLQGTLYDVSDRKAAEEALLAYIQEMVLRIQQPVGIIRDNLEELAKLVDEGKVTRDEIFLVLMGQVRNASRIALNVEEFRTAIAEKKGDVPESYRRLREDRGGPGGTGV